MFIAWINGRDVRRGGSTLAVEIEVRTSYGYQEHHLSYSATTISMEQSLRDDLISM